MKKSCSAGEKCKGRQPSWSNPNQDDLYPPTLLEVPDNHPGPYFCSIECSLRGYV